MADPKDDSLENVFGLPLKLVFPDRWYLCATCQSCRKPIPVMLLQGPNVPNTGDGSVRWQIQCPHCLQSHEYQPDKMTPQKAESTPAPEEPTH